ncbi:MAG: hypothetical protein IJQ07_00260 [Clostridia bacterium]|nr:hypothetical protein [Clostridia bacterium]
MNKYDFAKKVNYKKIVLNKLPIDIPISNISTEFYELNTDIPPKSVFLNMETDMSLYGEVSFEYSGTDLSHKGFRGKVVGIVNNDNGGIYLELTDRKWI